MTGIEIIAEERKRQIEKEGWTPEHDDQHKEWELSCAAQHYIDAAAAKFFGMLDWKRLPFGWPWSVDWWKPSEDPIRNLAKAGALIAAEIDRLQRLNGK